MFSTTRAKKFSVIKLKSSGKPDSSFGTNGIVATQIFNNYGAAYSVKLQTDLKLLVGGYTGTNSGANFAMVRYNNSNSAQPVSFLNFLLTKKEKSVLLDWQTVNQINGDHFSIERCTSLNTFSWQEIGQEYIKDNGLQPGSYSLEDIHPAKGNNFYRIKEVDKDGKCVYTIVLGTVSTTIVSIYPNPVIDVIHINSLDIDAKTQLTIVDETDKLVGLRVVNHSYDWDVHQLHSGIYFLNVESKSQHA